MEISKHYQEITNLANKLVRDLFTNEHFGLTRNWMCQYIAELMTKAEIEKNDEKRHELKKECFNIVLKLWEYRASIPGEVKPLGRLKETLSILQSLRRNDNNSALYWKRYNCDSTTWGQFMHNINDAIENILKIALFASKGQDALRKESEWLQHRDFLTKEEQGIIENLEYLLLSSNSKFIINIPPLEEQDDRSERRQNTLTELIMARLQSLIDDQQIALDKLKQSFKKNQG